MKTLIAYATRYGSVTNAVAKLVPLLDGEVETVRLGRDPVPDPEGFDRVLVGGSVYMGRVQPEVERFCKEHRASLLRRRLAFFLCAGDEDEGKRREALSKKVPEDLLEHASSLGWFGSEVHWEEMTWLHRLALRMATGTKESYSDLREENIASFAEALKG
jgi:menaquinone-dependent protoporphyrinogen oxidase